MSKITAALTALLIALAAPSAASAHKQRHRHHRHAHASLVTGCEYGGEEKTWSEWRADMTAEGFTADEVEELEACDES